MQALVCAEPTCSRAFERRQRRGMIPRYCSNRCSQKARDRRHKGNVTELRREVQRLRRAIAAWQEECACHCTGANLLRKVLEP